MSSYHTTADWAVAQLRRADWISRHEMIDGLSISKPALYAQICKRMAPSELLDGKASGVRIGERTPIILPDKARKGYRQLSLHSYFRPMVKKPQYKQLRLDQSFQKR